MAKLPSFSKLELADKCQFPWTSGIRHPEFDTKRGLYGKAIHSVAECIGIWGDAPVGDISSKFELDATDKDKLINIYVELCDFLDGEQVSKRFCEFAFGFQMHTGRVRVLSMDFDSPYHKRWRRRSNEIIGIIDLLWTDTDDRLHVRDYKTGRYKMFQPPLEDLQLMGYGLAMSRFMKRDEVEIEFCNLSDGVNLKSATMDSFMLEWAWERMHEIAAKSQDKTNDVPKPGPWCRELFCPIVAKCPATAASIEAIDKSSKVRLPMIAEIESDDHARYLLERMPAVESALERIKDALRKRYTGRALELEDGNVWGQFEETRETIVVNETALGILNKALDGKATHLVESKVSKSAIKATCKDVAPPRGAAALQRRIMDELREEGLINEQTFTKYRKGKVKR